MTDEYHEFLERLIQHLKALRVRDDIELDDVLRLSEIDKEAVKWSKERRILNLYIFVRISLSTRLVPYLIFNTDPPKDLIREILGSLEKLVRAIRDEDMDLVVEALLDFLTIVPFKLEGSEM